VSKFDANTIHEARTLLRLGVSRCRTRVNLRHRHTPVITLNYVISLNYYLCRRVRVVSGVYVSASKILTHVITFNLFHVYKLQVSTCQCQYGVWRCVCYCTSTSYTKTIALQK